MRPVASAYESNQSQEIRNDSAGRPAPQTAQDIALLQQRQPQQAPQEVTIVAAARMQDSAEQSTCTAIVETPLPATCNAAYEHPPKAVSSLASSSIGAESLDDHEDECPVKRAWRLASCSPQQMEAHRAAAAAAAAAAASEASSGVPTRRIASWISCLPGVSDCHSEGPEPAPALSTSSHSWHDIEYEKAACDPSLARPSVWYSSVGSDMGEPVGCCAFFKFLAPPI